MKKILLSLILAGILFPVLSQKSNLIIFSENGERFQVVLNGVLQNAEPETNVLITDLIAPSYKVKIVFEAEVPDLDKTIYYQNGSSQDTYMLKVNKKGEFVLRFQNSVPIAQAPPPPATQIVHVYSTTPPAAAVSVTQTTTTTTHVEAPGASTNVNMNTNVGNMNMNVSINESSTMSSSTTTSTTTTSTGVAVGTTSTEVVYVLPGYDGYYGCPYPMEDSDFQIALRSIDSKSFSDSKLLVAKQVLDKNCVLSTQVMQIMEQFDFEEDKLEIAKYAYGSTLDIGNYFRVNDAFDFESSIEELDTYIINYRR